MAQQVIDLKARARRRSLWTAMIYLMVGLQIPIILYGWWHGSSAELMGSTHGLITTIGRLGGLLGAYAIILDFLFVARLPFFENTLGRPLQLKLHKWAGYAAFLLLTLHFVCLTIGYSMMDKQSIIGQFFSFANSYEDVFNSILAYLLMLFIVGLSVWIVRKRLAYETWYYVHLFSYLMILLAFGHQMKVGVDFIANPTFVAYWWFLYILLFLVVVVYRFGKPIFLSLRHGLRVDEVVAETHDTYSIYIRGKALERLHYNGGQFAIWWFVAAGKWWQGHPFSFSATPGGERLRITIKKSGDYTNTIDTLKPGTWLVMDGPYGIFTAASITRPKLLMIGGGIGITPLVSMMQEAAQISSDIILLYAAKTVGDLALKTEIDQVAGSLGIRVTYIISDDPQYSGEKGLLDQPTLARLVPDAKDREVFLCGPPPMMKAVTASLVALGVSKTDVHTEDFSF